MDHDPGALLLVVLGAVSGVDAERVLADLGRGAIDHEPRVVLGREARQLHVAGERALVDHVLARRVALGRADVRIDQLLAGLGVDPVRTGDAHRPWRLVDRGDRHAGGPLGACLEHDVGCHVARAGTPACPARLAAGAATAAEVAAPAATAAARPGLDAAGGVAAVERVPALPVGEEDARLMTTGTARGQRAATATAGRAEAFRPVLSVQRAAVRRALTPAPTTLPPPPPPPGARASHFPGLAVR